MRYSDRDALKLGDNGTQIGGVVAAAVGGAVLMYLFDPQRGASRRAAAGSTLRQAGREASHSVSSAAQDLSRRGASAADRFRNRGANVADSLRSSASDGADRFRSSLDEGAERLRSSVAHGADSVHHLAERAHTKDTWFDRPRGRDSLEPVSPNEDIDWDTSAHGHDVPKPPRPPSAINRLVPAALGAMVSPKAGSVAALFQSMRDQTWNPKTRNLALLGGALSLYSIFAKRSPLTVGAGVVATALLAKGTQSAVQAANAVEAERTGHAGAVHVEKTIRIDASPEDVFDLWTNYEQFPQFMANVVEVREIGADMSHWTVKGPGGNYEWDSILTEKSRPHCLAWRSVPGAKVEQRGEVYLEPFRGGTRATVRMTYIPPAGKAGQAVATLLGKNPKAQLEDDLERMKELLERGSLPHSAARAEAPRSRFLR